MAALSDFTGINFIYTFKNSYNKNDIHNSNKDYNKAIGNDLNYGEQL
ncbi:UNVERIFIED_CONTAM: hypothetical protein O8I53_13865 [Campylobacter lari]